ncbi:hypothetical protein DWV78_13815 [Agathobacter rectalis]|uniref:beta-N-acetylhexosaminidase n=2 Tax=Clostridia TaxID=186801 RepID=A0A413BCZ4_9FIRM|nr:hypothetical protein DWV78_13815 [Agathobacter rectalis]
MMAEISFIWRGYGLSLKREEKKYMNNKHWIKNLFGAIAIPLLVAILLQGLCIIKGRTMIANMTSFDNFVVYIAIVMITTIALSINLNSGRFDFSLGSMATLSSVLGAKITYSVLDGGNYSALMMFVLTLLIGMLLGLISGILYVVLHLPPIITSLGVTLIYEGILFTITEGRYVMKEVQNKSMTAFTGNWIYAAIIIVAVLLISIAIFDYTKFGYDYNALKNGQKVAVNTGIKEIPNAIGCYVICGGLMGIVGFLNAARNTTINGGQLNFGSISIMFTAFLPMFIGSYISRFTNEKIGFFLAALCMSMLNSTFAVFSNEVNASMQAIINAVLLVVFLIYLSNEQLLVKFLQEKERHNREDISMINLTKKPFFLAQEDIEWVENTKNSMTVEEKIGQLFVPIGYSGDSDYLDNVMLSHHIGGIMYRCGESKEMQQTHRYLQEHSRIPLLIGANLEDGGCGIATDGTQYGKQMQVAATADTKDAYRLGKVSCSEGAAVGCNWAFAPVVDIDRNWRNPITNVRTYGDDPDRVLECGLNYMKAAKEENVLVAIKHFPGDGCDEVDQHILTSVNSLSCEEWDATYGKIYGGLIEAGAQTVMVGHIAQPAYQKLYNPDFPDKLVPATLSPELLKGLLRKKLGFNGLIVTDSTCMVGFSCAMKREKAVPYAIEAGCDMFLFNKDLDEDYNYMLEGYKQGILSEQRLDEAITRILATKAALGLHKKAKNEIVPNEATLNILKNEEHVKWAKNSADKAVTLVKDTAGILPLSPRKTKKVLLEIMGDFPSNERVLESFRTKLSDEGFEVTVYEHENFETARFDVETFKKSYDLVIYIGNVENASNKVTNRLSWYTFWGNGNNVPWFVAERPVVFISLANPYHLVDVPMIKTYINGYSNSEYVIESVMDKLMGRSSFTGKSSVNPFCGKEYLKW